MAARVQSSDLHSESVITAIIPLPSDPNLRRVRVGRQTVARLRTADIDALRLAVGKPWTKALAARVETAVALNDARRLAMGMLSRRGYSRIELTDRLVKRGCMLTHAQQTVQQLHDDGWMNERAYAEDVAKQTLRGGPAGRRLVEYRLKQRAVNPDLASDVASANTSQDPRHAALDFALARLGTMKGASPQTAARRAAGLLARRGFDDEVIADVLEMLGLGASQSD